MFKTLLLVISLAIVVACALTFGFWTRRQATHKASNAVMAQANPPASQRRDAPPDRILYGFLFRHLAQLKKQADEHQRHGKDGAGFQRRFKNALLVDDDQFDRLNEIALNCEAEVASIDKRAEAVIEAFREQYPSGELPAGAIVPPPPPELAALQEERYRAVLRARDSIREALGEREFNRFNEIVKIRLTPDIKLTNPPR